MQVSKMEATRLVDLLNGGTVISSSTRGRTLTGHATGSTTLLRVDLSHDRVRYAFEDLLLAFVLQNC